MKRLRLSSYALAASLSFLMTDSGRAQQGTPNEFLLRVGRVHVGDGRVLEDVRIRVRDGKFTAIEADKGEVPVGVKVHDLRRMSIMPGLVAAHSDLVAVELEANLSPGSVAADQFDLYAKYDQLVRSGLTTVYLSPGRQRLVSGQGSVVKLAGKDPMQRMLKAQAALRVAVDEVARRNVPAIFEPTEAPTDDDPLLPARQQWGSTRASQLQALATAFAEARVDGLERGGVGSDLVRYPLEPLRQVLGRELPLRISTSSAADAWAALAWARGTGARSVLEKPVDATPLRDELARLEVPVVFAMPLRPHTSNGGDFEEDPDRRRLARPEAVGELARAGVRVAIVPASDEDLDKLRMLAGLAGRFGLPARSTLASITLDAAKILGVESRVGSIEVGKDADFVILTGAPFDARTQVEAVFVEGHEVHAREDKAPVFAIRASRVLRGDGEEYRNGVVIVKGGKIIDVGNIPVPGGIEVIDAGDAVLAPGFIAAATRLGLHGDAGGRFPAPTTADLTRALRGDDPAYRAALEAGITTLYVTPDDSGLVGPRVTAIKTAGTPEGFVVRDVVGIRMALSAGGDAGKKQLLDAIAKAKAYIDPPKAAPAAAPASPANNAAAKPEDSKTETKDDAKDKEKKDGADEAPFVDKITGVWKGSVNGGPLPNAIPFEFDAKLTDKTKVTGTLQAQSPIPMPPVQFSGTFENDVLELEGEVPQLGKLSLKGQYTDGVIAGKIASAQGELDFTMKKDGEVPVVAKPKKKKEGDKKDESLEPFRRVFAHEAALVVRVSNAEAAKAAIDAIAVQSKLKLVLAGNARSVVEEGVRAPSDVRIGFLLGAEEVVRSEKGEVQNMADEVKKLGFDVIFVSRAQTGTRYLPVHAAWAVSNGFGTRDALAAISAAPASRFGIEDRVGRLVVGNDADLVLWTGDPFDLTSRIQAVWVDGKLAVDHLQVESSTENK